ncbi:uncharacterized protein LOC103315369 [Nasonia vitripennis]|uniref:ATP-dependent DNA helicase n=1 Tax=Nasonia vitripennis TaxID=7425 RepID=A0A7M7H869_NASVI|nr:uncharacterized protein LOC103315369 [Nasonia vitripennis]
MTKEEINNQQTLLDPNETVPELQLLFTLKPAYTRYKIPIRPDEFNPFIMGRRLFQQYVVDSYVKIEKDRIMYCKNHQKEIKADTYQGLHDYMQRSANDMNGQVGKTIILPSTFIVSPRHMQQCYQDAKAIINRKGKPDIFLTMTCNPKWSEITENLLPHQQVSDRPDIVARVFHLKKECLPHMHLLITLTHGFKITTPEIVDKFISAENPDAQKPTLQEIVLKNMIHGPCDETNMDENGYPNYCRRNTGITYELNNGNVVNNTWVVPYCPTLLEMFNCHINVEVVTKARYVGPVEAIYRILSKILQDKSHAIIRLAVHLPYQQSIIIVGKANIIRENLNCSSSTLLDSFKLNLENPEARQYFYADIPSYFVHKKTVRKQQFNCIGRSTSFDDLKTVDGVIQPTFTAACLALGFIEDDEEWMRAMEEATVWMMPTQLRRLFVRILIHCQPVHPEELWEKFKDAMSEDFSRTNEITISYQKAYAHVNTLLNMEGRALTDFPTMEQRVEQHKLDDNTNNAALPQMAELGQQQYGQLNTEQKEIVDTVLHAVDINNHEIYTMAFTGIAATLLPHGKTVHQTFGLPVPMYHDSSSSIKAQTKEGQILKEADVFIWDEAPMAPRYALEIANRTLQYIMNNNLPFGGKIIILGGDFRQLLPIKINGTRGETLNLCIKYSELWKYFKNFTLTTNMRVMPNEVDFAKFLLEVGNGTLNDSHDKINVPEHCILTANNNMAYHLFGKLIEEKRFENMSKCAILSARNIDVDEINKQATNLLDIESERL